MKKRVIATVLACVMGMGLLTGCGSTAENSTTNNGAATESKTEGTAAASNEDLSWIIRKEEQSVYCPKSNRSLAEIMALKKYYSLLLLEAEEEFSLLSSYKKISSSQSRSRKLSSSDLLEESSPYYELLQSHFAKDKLPVSIQKWCAESYETNSSHPENLVHTTLAGHKVRS